MDLWSMVAVGGIFIVLISLIIAVAFYIVCSLGFMKALKSVGYPNAWLAWIPLVNFFALADAAANGEENINVIGTVTIPAMVYKLFIVVEIVVSFIPVVGSILALVVQVVCLGHVFMRLFSRVFRTSEQEQNTIAYISAFIPIVAAVKFLANK